MRKIRIGKRRKDGHWQRYWVVARNIKRRLEPFSSKVTIAGSLRRKKFPDDIDIVVVPKKDKLDNIKTTIRHLDKKAFGKDKRMSFKQDGIGIDVFFSDKKEYPFQLLRRTGPAGANIKNSEMARDKGLKLNEYGLFNRKTGKRVSNILTEKDIYEKLGKPYRKPEKRGELRK